MSRGDEQSNFIDSKLPTEIFCEVITAALDLGNTGNPTPLRRLAALRQVSKRWHDVIDERPAFWCIVTLADGPQLVEMALVKSKGCTLVVRYDENCCTDPSPEGNKTLNIVAQWCPCNGPACVIWKSTGEAFWTVLNRQRDRWGELDVSLVTDELFQHILPGSAPKLRKLSVRTPPQGSWTIRLDSITSAPFGGHLPLLEELEVRAWSFQMDFMLKNLRKLALSHGLLGLSPNDILEILSRCPDLEELDLSGGLAFGGLPTWTSPNIDLAKLVAIRLQVSSVSDPVSFVGIPFDEILEHIVLPTNSFVSVQQVPASLGMPALLRWIQRESPRWGPRSNVLIEFGRPFSLNYTIQLREPAEENSPGLEVNSIIDVEDDEDVNPVVWYDTVTHALDARLRSTVKLIEVNWNHELCGNILEVVVDAFPCANTLRLSHFHSTSVVEMLASPKTRSENGMTSSRWLFSGMTRLEVASVSAEDEDIVHMGNALRQVMMARASCVNVQPLQDVVVFAFGRDGARREVPVFLDARMGRA